MVPCDQRKQRGGCCAAWWVHGVLPVGVTKVALQGHQRVVHCSRASNPNTASKVSPSSLEILNPLKSYEASPPSDPSSCYISLAQLGSSPPQALSKSLGCRCDMEALQPGACEDVGSEWFGMASRTLMDHIDRPCQMWHAGLTQMNSGSLRMLMRVPSGVTSRISKTHSRCVCHVRMIMDNQCTSTQCMKSLVKSREIIQRKRAQPSLSI